MSKWKITLGICAALSLSSGYGVAIAQAESVIQLNYKDTGLGNMKVIAENTTFVPLKSLAGVMGYTLSWDPSMKSAKLIRPEREIILTSGDVKSKINGVETNLAKTPRIIKGVLYVPLVSAVKVLGGNAGVDKESNIQIADGLRFVTASSQGRSYWISQKNGDVYTRNSITGKPAKIGKLPLKESPYNHIFEIKSLENGTDLLQLQDNHYAMFNDFSNSYQALVQAGTILKQMNFSYNMTSNEHVQQVKSTQLFMTDGKKVQYVKIDGQLGKEMDLEKLTGASGEFVVEYAAADVALVRLLRTTKLFAINIATGEVTNLNERLISVEDRKDWDKATDSNDQFILRKMLMLTGRNGNVLTFSYTPLFGEKAKKVSYTIGAK